MYFFHFYQSDNYPYKLLKNKNTGPGVGNGLVLLNRVNY